MTHAGPSWCDRARCTVFDSIAFGAAHRGHPRVVEAQGGLRVAVQLVQAADAMRPSVRLVAGEGLVMLHVGRAEDLSAALRSLAEEARP